MKKFLILSTIIVTLVCFFGFTANLEAYSRAVPHIRNGRSIATSYKKIVELIKRYNN